MYRILLIDDDPGTMDATGRLLQFEGYSVAWAASGGAGLSVLREQPIDIAMIDLRLPDASGIDVLKAIRAEWPGVACVIVTGHAGLESAVEAIRVGAVDYLTKPLIGEDLVDAVRRIGTSHVPAAAVGHDIERHAHARWADVVTRAAAAPRDPRTLHDWGRSIGASTGAIRNWCRTARLPARRSLLLARVLRAVLKHQQFPAAPEDLLDIVDRRTMVKLLTASGGTRDCLPATVEDLLQRQQLITDGQAIAALQTAIAKQAGRGTPRAGSTPARSGLHGAA